MAVSDEAVFEVLDKLSDYEQLLIELCAVIQDGHILFSRAQYDSGQSAINPTFLPEPGQHVISPTSTLQLTENQTFSLVTTTPDPKSGVRKRKKEKKERKEEKEDEETKDSNKEADKPPPGPIQLADDPLNWFGLMAPTSLVQSQTRFKAAIERVVELSNLKQELNRKLGQFEDLSSEFQEKCTVENTESHED